MRNEDIVSAFHTRIKEIKQKHSNRQFNVLPDQKEVKDGNRFVAVIDSISSMPGVLLPWKELVKVCQEEGVWTIIDAAHSIGQEVNKINYGFPQLSHNDTSSSISTSERSNQIFGCQIVTNGSIQSEVVLSYTCHVGMHQSISS
jgi:cysteine sulfinate desulfinase/cysteine desulfurase-like protein